MEIISIVPKEIWYVVIFLLAVPNVSFLLGLFSRRKTIKPVPLATIVKHKGIWYTSLDNRK